MTEFQEEKYKVNSGVLLIRPNLKYSADFPQIHGRRRGGFGFPFRSCS